MKKATRPGGRRATRLRSTAAAVGLGVLVTSVLGLAAAPSAQAEDAAAARAQARAAADAVAAIQVQLRGRQRAYTEALSSVGTQVSDFLLADGDRAEAQQAADAASDRTAASARALYQSGGQAGLLDSVLESASLEDLAGRLQGVSRVLTVADLDADDAHRRAKELTRTARQRSRDADRAVVTAADLSRQTDQIEALLADAQQTLDGLSERARSLTAAEHAAAALAAARASFDAAQQAGIGAVRAQAPPEVYFRLYRAAATTCPGMPWTLLAAVGQVESGHGRNAGVSSAGAVGPMQFMPRTFAAYAVDGDHDGRADPYSPADAVYTAARYLCSNGAGSPSGVQRALFAYNRAQWYVDLVLSVQSQLVA